MKFRARENFNWSGTPISFNKSNELLFHEKNGWVKDEIYEGKYYQGGVACPVEGYFIEDSNGNMQIFTIRELSDTYMPIDKYFEKL